jgi:hypothetical protein
VIGFGVLATLAGVWQVVTGRRHIVIMIVTLLAAGAILLQGWQVTDSIKQAQEADQPRRFVQPPAPMAPVNLGAPAPDKPSQ